MKLSSFILPVLITLLLMGCDLFTPINKNNKTGSINIEILESSRTITPSISMDIASYDISGEGPSSNSFGPESITDTSFNKNGMAIGEWEITVQGKNANGDIIATGSGTVDLKSGADTSLSINLLPLSGNGEFSLNLDWPIESLNTPVINANFGPTGGALTDLSLTINSDSAKLTKTSYPSGYYTLTVDILDGTSPRTSIIETVRIVANNETAASFSLTAKELSKDTTSPVIFSLDEGEYNTAQSLSLFSRTDGAKIRYTNNGSVPTPTAGIEYKGPIDINCTQNIRAIAYKDGYNNSSLTTSSYIITNTIPVPIVELDEGIYIIEKTLKLIKPAGDYGIIYTLDGSDPDTTSTPINGEIYAGEIPLELDTLYNFKVRLFNPVNLSQFSDIIAAEYNMTGVVADPVLSVSSGTYNEEKSLELTTTTSGATIYYTVDGSEPTAESGIEYDFPIDIDKTMDVKAIAIKENWQSSEIKTGNYILKPITPTFTLTPDSYTDESITVGFECDTPDVDFIFTRDNSIPVSGEGNNGSSATLYVDTVLKVIAVKPGWTDSDLLSGSFEVRSTTISPENGTQSDPGPLLDFPGTVGATKYRVELSSSSDFSTVIESNDSLTESEFQETEALSPGETYYWRYSAYNGSTWSDWSTTNNFIRKIIVGDNYGGGIVFYVDGSGGGLIASEADQHSSIFWYRTGFDSMGLAIDGANGESIGAGLSNTTAIVNAQGAGTYAAKLCYDLELNGYNDWFLPSINELYELYNNRAIIGGFSAGTYWSSSEIDYRGVNALSFSSGDFVQAFMEYTNYSYKVRAIREF